GVASGLLLRVILLHVEQTANSEQHGRGGHQAGEDPEEVYELQSREVSEQGDQHVTEGDRQVEEAHDRGLHALGRLRIGKFQGRDRDHDFADREQDVRNDLPDEPDLAAAERIDAGLDQRRGDERKSREHHANRHAAKWRRPDAQPITTEIDDVEEWNQDHDQERIQSLNLVRQNLPAKEAQVHEPGLLDPGRSVLVEERPEHADEQQNGNDL